MLYGGKPLQFYWSRAGKATQGRGRVLTLRNTSAPHPLGTDRFWLDATRGSELRLDAPEMPEIW